MTGTIITCSAASKHQVLILDIRNRLAYSSAIQSPEVNTFGGSGHRQDARQSFSTIARAKPYDTRTRDRCYCHAWLRTRQMGETAPGLKNAGRLTSSEAIATFEGPERTWNPRQRPHWALGDHHRWWSHRCILRTTSPSLHGYAGDTARSTGVPG